MTTLGDRRSVAPPEWLPPLQHQIERARFLLCEGGENSSPHPARAGQAEQALRQASEGLVVALDTLGVETPIGWRLHQLRSRLDAHLLAASALADADAGNAMISVLRRSLDLLGPELEALAALGALGDGVLL
ncbi:MAG: hypothetical protein ACRDZ8_15590 [Acidimicrobiales bacterium]